MVRSATNWYESGMIGSAAAARPQIGLERPSCRQVPFGAPSGRFHSRNSGGLAGVYAVDSGVNGIEETRHCTVGRSDGIVFADAI